MKKFILPTLIFWGHILCANPIDTAFAKQIALNFYKYNAPFLPNEVQATLVKQYDARIERLSASIPMIYIFNINHTEGFVIVSGDDAALPILGYSTQGAFNANDVPINMQKWFENYRAEMREIVENQQVADSRVTEKWQSYQRFTGASAQPRMAVSPLLTTQWNQSPYYNDLCPNDAAQGARSVTGCAATAMAQVMKYWNHPAQGTGFHSYNHAAYGTLSANFGSTTYNWASMPNRVTSANTAVATLMYHCGVSIDMGYSPTSSGAYVIDAFSPPNTATAEKALKTYFGYVSTLRGVLKSNYTTSQWMALLKAELNANRPLLHAGFGTGGGHAFVCDGYDNNDFFHFNWGWGGSSDGYFWHDALNPGSTGTGGGASGYNANQQVIIGVQPNPNSGGGTTPMNMKMYSNITVTPNPILYQQAFTVKANLINRSASTFYGEVAAALFDNNSNFVTFIKTLTESNGLQQNYFYLNGGLNFDNTGLQAPPGNYFVGIYTRPTGGEWSLVGNEGSNTNWLPITITNPTGIQLYGQLRTTPATLTQNQAFTTWLDLVNRSATPFNGKLSVDLHKMNGDHIQEITTMSNVQLDVNHHFINGLTFNSTGLNVDAGTYQVAAWAQRTGGNWELVGSTAAYFNPITVNMTAPALQPDIYEANNTETTCYAVNPAFTNDAAAFASVGSNIHNSNDYDYYRLNLPTGYNYSITARVHDSYNSANGQTYTNDVIFSYRKKGVNAWSDAFDDRVPAPVTVVNGGFIDFWVSPFFLGKLGTYLLDVKITRTLHRVSTQELMDLPFQIYPNPVHTVLNLDWKQAGALNLESIEIYDVLGRVVQRTALQINTDNYSISTEGLTNGTYQLVLHTEKGILRKKLVIQHP